MQNYPALTRQLRTSAADGWTPTRPPWPQGARCVFLMTVDFDGPSNDVGRGYRPLGVRSAGRYAARCGVPRYLDMLERLGVPATFFVPGYDAECHPALIRSIAGAGHEVAAHGYEHEGMLLPPAEEERRLRLAHDILSNLLGEAPRGWRSPGGQKTAVTLPVLRSLGYGYDSSDKDCDMPYLLNLGQDDRMVELPNNTLSLDDFPWFSESRTPVSEVLRQWQREFDAIYADRGYFMFVVHPRAAWGSGTPARARAVEAMIRYAQSHRDVHFMRLHELAGWVNAQADHFEEMTPYFTPGMPGVRAAL
jgi:peptidoglycan/xylan/chitin deacetylase (PgdA/CDA1 family)